MRREPALPARRAFTLLEVMFSIAIASGLAAVAWTGFFQMRQVARRNEVETSLVVDAGFIYRRLCDELTSLQPGTQMRVERTPLSAAVFGASAYRVSITWMRSLSSPNPGNGMADLRKWSEYSFEDLWTRWEWRPPKLVDKTRSPGSLCTGSSSASTRSKAFSSSDFPDLSSGQSRTLYTAPQARRDRRRDLDDNDYRLMPNASLKTGIRTTGDRTDLVGEDANLNGVLDAGEDINGNGVLDPGTILPICSRVSGLTLAWVDFGGWTTTVDAVNGVVVRDAGGSVVAPAGTAWWNGEARCVDGLYRDGRDDTAGSDTGRSVILDRPALLRANLTLKDVNSGIERSFSFSFPLGLESPAATGL